MIDRLRTCCFTGHRRIAKEDVPALQERLYTKIEELITRGVLYFGCGGAIGFDMMAGFAVLKLKRKYPAIRLIMVLPSRDQAARWSEKDRSNYVLLLAGADKKVYVSDSYTDKCMLERNDRLVSFSGYCIAYLRNMRSGTAYTVRRAREQGVQVFNMAQ